MGNSTKNWNKLIVFEIAKTNNEMMSSVLSNILRGPGGNSSKQVHLIHMHASRHNSEYCHTGSTNTSSLWFVDTFDKSQTSIQHSHPCDFMNMKENILFLRNEWTTTGEVDKTDRTDLRKWGVFTYATKHKETMKHKRSRQKTFFVKCKKHRQIIIKEEGSNEEDRQEEADVKTFFC